MPRFDALDWLKAIGICLIVYGHVGASSTVTWTPPIYVKQLGVAFFVFAAGFTLARERRPWAEALITRLFQIYLFGLTLAGIITTIGLLSGAGLASGSGLALSNYLPFVGGANVVFNNFPANPTTWYIGTYLHLVVLWAVWLRHRRVDRRLVVGALLLEIPVRAALIEWAGPFVAYMLLTNWLTVFLLGARWGGRPAGVERGSPLPFIAALVVGLAAWAVTWRFVDPEPTFPFMTLHWGPTALGVLFLSTAVSTLYLSITLITFAAARRLTAPAPVKFLARNSLLVFLAHMPVYFALDPVLVSLQWTYPWRTFVLFIVCLVLLAFVSELIVRVVKPKQLSDGLRRLLLGEKSTSRTPEPIGA